jgi:dGTPase
MPSARIDGYLPADLERLRGEHDGDERSPFARDYDRLIYTEEFRRLQGKTQVATPGEAEFFRSRLTHTIEVAQLARRLAEHFNRKADAARRAAGRPLDEVLTDPESLAKRPADQHRVDPDLCEAAAVLHDLGHSPFGHVGEQALADEVRRVCGTSREEGGWELDEHGSFNANAQSFRLVTTCVVHADPRPGLQLTRATLDASLKYPWAYGEGSPGTSGFSVFPTERADLDWVRDGLPEGLRQERTLEAEIMDWADDVAYAVHDLDDWHRASYMPLVRLATNAYGAREELRQWILDKWLRKGHIEEGDVDDVKAIFEDLFCGTEGAFQEFRNRIEAAEPVWDPSSAAGLRAIRALRSVLFDELLTSVAIIDRPGAPADVSPRYRFQLEVDPVVRRKNELLKELLWHYVVQDSRIGTQQHGQRESVKALFSIHEEAARCGDRRLFPARIQKALEESTGDGERLRLVVDHLSGMTDGFALRRLQRLQGGDSRLHDFN